MNPRYAVGLVLALVLVAVLGVGTSQAAPSLLFQGAVDASGASRPATVSLSADGNLTVTHVHWSAWGGRDAFGTGTAYVSTCGSTCAHRHTHTYVDARVELSTPVRCGGHVFYDRVTLAESDGKRLDTAYLSVEDWAPCRAQ